MYKRKNYFIKKKFQAKFLIAFVLLLLLESALIAGLFMHISSNTVTTGYVNSTLRVESTQNFFFTPFIFIVCIVGVGIGMAAMVVFLLLSHRIAGPLYRFEKVLSRMKAGDLTTNIHLRKTDELVELKDALNTFITSFDERLSRMKNALNEVKELLSRTDDAQSAEELKAKINFLVTEINQFKVTSDSKE